MITEEKQTRLDRLITLLEEKGYTDTVDVNTEISLYEYGIARNPKTGDCVFCIPDCTWEDNEPVFHNFEVTADDVFEDLKNTEQGYFDFIGAEEGKQAYARKARKAYAKNPEINLSGEIQSLQAYHGGYPDEYPFDLDTIIARIMSA